MRDTWGIHETSGTPVLWTGSNVDVRSTSRSGFVRLVKTRLRLRHTRNDGGFIELSEGPWTRNRLTKADPSGPPPPVIAGECEVFATRHSTFPPMHRLFQKSPDRPALGETAERSLNAKLRALFGRQSERRRDPKLALRMQFPPGCRPTPPDSLDFPDDALAQGGFSVRLAGIRGRFAVHVPSSHWPAKFLLSIVNRVFSLTSLYGGGRVSSHSARRVARSTCPVDPARGAHGRPKTSTRVGRPGAIDSQL